MKFLTTLLALLSTAILSLAADPPTTHLYKGEIAGVACAACGKKVKASLEKLPGVTSVKLTPGGDSGIAKIELSSTSPDITKASAIAALGKAAEDYTLINLDEVKP